MDRIINKWDKKTLSCDEATEKSTAKLLTLIKQVVEEVIGTDEYPEDNEQNVNYKRTNRNYNRKELRKEQRAKLDKLLK